jgi:hypothetical protein
MPAGLEPERGTLAMERKNATTATCHRADGGGDTGTHDADLRAGGDIRLARRCAVSPV